MMKVTIMDRPLQGVRARGEGTNPYKDFVEKFSKLMREGKSYPLGGYSSSKPRISDDSPKVILFSPHPDDECLTGALPLRLMREMNMNIINVPVTFGGNVRRRKERYQELKSACDYLGFKILLVQEDGLSNINIKGKIERPKNWASAIEKIANILKKERPYMIFLPHDKDFNTTHTGTHELVFNSLHLSPNFGCYVVEWEYWAPMERPNLLVEVSRDYLVELITATSFHAGEVKRNPQHVNLPAWMHDNVRRGSELVGGQGCTVPNFEFAALYRLRRWINSNISDLFEEGRFISSRDNLSDLFE